MINIIVFGSLVKYIITVYELSYTATKTLWNQTHKNIIYIATSNGGEHSSLFTN